uniref:Uncharacterized protein n=1 Tax=Oncorhynchus tshawytscha TaxID=74940 RepID=A0A8C8FUK1_ONCTS
MAINTDAAFGKSALGEREVSHPTDFQDTEKLLSAVTTEPTGESSLKPSDTSLNLRSSIHSLNAEQTGHQSPLRSDSAPVSPSQLSFGPPFGPPLLLLRSPVPPGLEPPSYLWLAVLSCFCLAVPVNMFALWYAHMVSFLALVCGMRWCGAFSKIFCFQPIVICMCGKGQP